jgi:hypothetical protein
MGNALYVPTIINSLIHTHPFVLKGAARFSFAVLNNVSLLFNAFHRLSVYGLN